MMQTPIKGKMLRLFLIMVALLLSAPANAASLKPQVPATERAVYTNMLKTNPAAAKAYLITREYVSQCRQVVANPQLAIDLPDEPDGFDPKYVTKAEFKMMNEAVQQAFAAFLDKKNRKK
jgi:hypothetical protein